ncbi:MAG: hypothetical protein IT426_20355 [Pirellulales bacterium]|nr:hypothetical protein [Pirellulales bacterium]
MGGNKEKGKKGKEQVCVDFLFAILPLSHFSSLHNELLHLAKMLLIFITDGKIYRTVNISG